MDRSDPVGIGIAGIGGYAGSIANLVLESGSRSAPPARLVAVCDPALEEHASRAADLRGRRVDTFASFDQLLGHSGVDAVWLPLPIHLHRSFTEQALQAGKAVIVEKPAAGCLQDVDAMIAARDQAGLPVAVGFQDVYDSTTLPLKRRLLDGEIGRVTHATVHASWPRSDRYFARSPWAGRVRVGDTWVLDSPANNALAHYINIALFLLGPTLDATATAVEVEGELYRAAQIENYDTITTRVTLAGGAQLVILFTHACAKNHGPVLRFDGEGGSITRTQSQIVIERSGQQPHVIERDRQMHANMVQRLTRLIRGEDDPEIAVATLEMAREHTRLMSAVSEFIPVVTIPEAAITPVQDRDGSAIRAVPDIEAAIETCAEQRLLLSELGQFDWTRPATRHRLDGYERFAGPPTSDETSFSTLGRG